MAYVGATVLVSIDLKQKPMAVAVGDVVGGQLVIVYFCVVGTDAGESLAFGRLPGDFFAVRVLRGHWGSCNVTVRTKMCKFL